MIREKLYLTVHGANQVEIKRRVLQIASEYFGIEVEQVEKNLDVELDVTALEGKPESFSANAYVRVRH